MPDLYLENGFVNHALWYKDPSPFIVCLGGRGTGKTYGALSDVVAGHYGKIVYVRRTDTQMQAVKIAELNPFKRINSDTGSNLMFAPLGKSTAGIYHGEVIDGVIKPAGEPVGIGVALSVFSHIRGVDGMDYDTVIFDEFISERTERPIKNEAEAFLNMYETLNRNREMPPLNRPPLKCVLLANTNDLRSAILDALGLVDIIDRMIQKGQEYKRVRNGMLSIYLYQDSPVSRAKKQTALYQVANSADFSEMALSNKFSRANYEYVKSCPLREYTPLVTIGDVTVYEHAREAGLYYVVDGIKSDNIYTTYPVDLRAFRADYFYLYEALLDKSLYYSSASVKIRFERVWNF